MGLSRGSPVQFHSEFQSNTILVLYHFFYDDKEDLMQASCTDMLPRANITRAMAGLGNCCRPTLLGSQRFDKFCLCPSLHRGLFFHPH